jgi:hypothetical protein
MGSNRRRSKASNDKYDYKSVKSIYEGGKPKSTGLLNSKGSSRKNQNKQYEDLPKVTNFEDPIPQKMVPDNLSDAVVYLPDEQEKAKANARMMN